MTEWQPIETAPRDGTEVLAIEDGSVAVVHWCEYSEPHQWRDYSDLGAAGIVPFEPTHWMPLPAPPK